MTADIVCAECGEEAARRASGTYRKPYQHRWGPVEHGDLVPRKVPSRTFENGRSYARGFAPSELMHPISATCARCGGSAVIYPAGLVCRDGCSLPDTEAAYQNDLDRRRKAAEEATR